MGLWLIRTERGHLTLHQRRPKSHSKNKVLMRYVGENGRELFKMKGNKSSLVPTFAHGQIFRINEFPGSKTIIPSKDNLTMVEAELYIPAEGEELHQEMWVTRWHGLLTLHNRLEPTRMRDSEQYEHMTEEKKRVVSGIYMHTFLGKIKQYKRVPTGYLAHYIKKDANKWTSWRGHYHVCEFPGSENITQEDVSPTRVEVRIKRR